MPTYYDRNTSCFLTHPFSKGKRKKCKAIKACLQDSCADLKPIESLYNNCRLYCNEDPNLTKEYFLCDIIGGKVLYENYNLIECGFNPDEKKKKNGSKYALKDYLIWGVMGLMIVGIVVGVFRLLR